MVIKKMGQVKDRVQDVKLEASESLIDCNAAKYDSERNLLETDMSAQPLVECSIIAAETMGNLPQANTDGKLARNNLDMEHVSKEDMKETRKRNGEKFDQEVEVMSNLHLTNRQATSGEFIKDEVVEHENLINSCEDRKAVKLLHVVEVSGDGVSSILGEVGAELALDPLKVNEKALCSVVKADECLLKDFRRDPRKMTIKRELLVLDVNGLLADIVMPAPKDRRGDVHILGRAIFRRPFCDDFLKFCFQNFDVAIWSSRSKKVIDRVVDYLLGDLKHKLLFCWDMAHTTQTVFKTLENIHKPLVFKELKKIWENDHPDSPWKKGDYDESNTLLLDDSPYKALLNPKHTTIFPNSYHYQDKDDDSLGPGGDLRVYLEGLLASENVQNYVEQHPYGQQAINETSLSWEFYSRVLQSVLNPEQENNPGTAPNSSSH